MFIIASQSKTLEGSFIYQATVNNAWFDKDVYKVVITMLLLCALSWQIRAYILHSSGRQNYM